MASSYNLFAITPNLALIPNSLDGIVCWCSRLQISALTITMHGIGFAI